MSTSKAQQEATERYNYKAYDEIKLRLPLGRRAVIEELAQNNGLSLNETINRMLAVSLGFTVDDWKYSSDYVPKRRQAETIHTPVPVGFREYLLGVIAARGQTLDDFMQKAILDELQAIKKEAAAIEKQGDKAETPEALKAGEQQGI